jgi:hypothetical protein
MGTAATIRGRANLHLGNIEDAAENAAGALQMLGPSEHIHRANALILLGDVGVAKYDAELARDAVPPVTSIPKWYVAAGPAYLVALLSNRFSLLTEKLARRGRHITREYGVNPLHVLRVEEVMDPPLGPPAQAGDVVTYPDELLETAMSKLLEHELEGIAVASRDDPARLVGYVERSAILAAWVQLTRDEHTIEEGWLGRLRRAPR